MSELDELVRQRRFDEIHDARRQVIEDERSINEAMAIGRVNDGHARRLFQRAVDAYVRELEYLLNPPDSNDQNRYWHSERVGVIDLPDGSQYAVEGLGEYLDLPEEISVKVPDIDQERYCHMPTEATDQVTVQPGWRLLRSAFRTANAAVSELGLELDVDDADTDRYGFREIKDVDELNPETWGDISLNGEHTNGETP